MDSLADLLTDHPEIRDWFVFTFVRNPWARAVSTWRNKVVDVNPDQPAAARRLERFADLYPGMPFDEFVDFLAHSPGGSDDGTDRHWTSQHLFLRDAAGEIRVDFVGRIERMAGDFQVVAERIGLGDVDLPLLNTRLGWTPRTEEDADAVQRHDDYRNHYTPRTRDLIAERYATDIELFGYDF